MRHLRFPNPEIPLLFLDVDHLSEHHYRNGTSYWNIRETTALAELLDRLYDDGIPPKSIGVITFYSGEVAFARQTIPRLSRAPRDFTESIEVNSVDAYEGRDIDIVILVCVRSNGNGKIGFLKDAGRMNVALTRARSALFIIGNALTLGTCTEESPWPEFLKYCRDNCLVVRSLS